MSGQGEGDLLYLCDLGFMKAGRHSSYLLLSH